MHKIQLIQDSIDLLSDTTNLNSGFLHKLNLTNKKRSKRKDSLDAISKVCIIMLEFLELKSLKVGTHDKNSGGFIPLADYRYISDVAGLKLQRVKRVVKCLKKAGYLRVQKSYIRLRDGAYKSFTSIKTFAAAFFVDLGITQKNLDKAKKWKSEKTIPTEPTQSFIENNLEIIKNKIYAFSKILYKKPDTKQNIDSEKKRALILEADEIHKKTGLSYQECYKRLESLLT